LDEHGKNLEKEVLKQTSLLRQKDLQLLEKDREVSLYALASGMAHEINNPLGFVKSSFLSLRRKNEQAVRSNPK
jgi:nitrogen-specific signal transduction histidine kinase